MGVISDAIDALEDWCCDLFKDGIKSQFDGISELLTDTFAQTTGSGAKGNLVSNFLTKHPAQFTGTAGSAPTGYGIWATIETLCNNVVVPIGGFILTVILLNELCQMVIRGNNFKDFDDSIFIKWIIKALCGVILVANTYYIASALFSFGTNVCSNGLATLFGSGDYLSNSLALKKSALNSLLGRTDDGVVHITYCSSGSDDTYCCDRNYSCKSYHRGVYVSQHCTYPYGNNDGQR